MSYTYSDAYSNLRYHGIHEDPHSAGMTTLFRVPNADPQKQQTFMNLCKLLYYLRVIKTSAFQ